MIKMAMQQVSRDILQRAAGTHVTRLVAGETQC